MTRNHKCDWRLGASLAAAIAYSSAMFTPAAAIDSWVIDNNGCKMRINYASDSQILEGEAKNLARHYLSELGFTRPGLSQRTARVSSVLAVGEKWRVSFKYGGNIRNKTAVFLIDRNNGLIVNTEQVADGAKRLIVG